MKLRTTTPVSLSQIAWKIAAVCLLLSALVAGIFYLNRPVSADQYDDRIRALQQDMNEYQKEANRLNAQSITLANTLAQLANQRNALQAQIDISQAKHDKLVIEIKETEEEIKRNQDALGVTLADLYVDDSISPIEMLASSRGINEYLDKQEYRNSIRDELGNTIAKVRDLKAELTNQKNEVAQVLKEQKSARETLKAREREQSTLLAQTKSDESNYQKLIRDSKNKIEEARAQQAAMNARANQGGGYVLISGGSLSAYPWNSNNCYVDANALSYDGADGNGGDGYGYGCRQCTSYAAWKVAQATGRYYRNWGNGGQFASSAINAGYRNLGNRPQAGSIAVMWGNPGHVAWVEAVSADGSQVTISQYNWNYGTGWGMYSMMTLSSSVFDQYVKIT